MARTDTSLDYYLPFILKSFNSPAASVRTPRRWAWRAGWLVASCSAVATAFAYLQRHA